VVALRTEGSFAALTDRLVQSCIVPHLGGG
jgi:hypothetical protein